MAVADLNPRHQRFVQEYLLCLSAAEAYRRVYPKATPASAETHGPRLVRKGQVRRAIEEGLREMAEKVGLTVEYVLERLQLEAEREDERASHSARVRSVELIGKHLGMWQELPTVDEIAAAIIERDRPGGPLPSGVSPGSAGPEGGP